MVLQIVLVIILEKSELLHIIGKVLTFHNVMIFIKSVFNRKKNEYLYNIFSEKGLYKDKSNTGFF